MPPGLALWKQSLARTTPVSNIFMVPKVFEPMKFYCVVILKIRRVNRSNNNNIIHLRIVKQSLAISRDLALNESALKTRKVSDKVVSNKHCVSNKLTTVSLSTKSWGRNMSRLQTRNFDA